VCSSDLVDGRSVAFLSLFALVYPAIVRFSVPAFHREPGAQRFWFLVALFAFGLVAVTLAGNIDVFLLGWEVVGVTSVMLIAFFRHTLRSAQNSMRALVFYRLCDLGVLGAAVWMHHAFPSSDFAHLTEDAAIPTSGLVAAALLFGSLAKSAQLPMSTWLHRAMEGPAASSAIFYGALSVHLGPYLLLRTAPLWLPHDGVRVAMGCIGAATAVYARLVGSTRPDAKTSLAYATMGQLGVMFVELALGWHTLAMAHLWANAGLRTWQFLRSSSLIQDFQENPVVSADVMRARVTDLSVLLPHWLRERLYLAAQRQFWLDGLQSQFVARPVLTFFSWLALLERPLETPAGAAEPEGEEA
jgi:NADH:ubiquinone oxidoreductase subunit 5 (subunit L)/multisubunit Na+/H+ antiporter MnhA subunit